MTIELNKSLSEYNSFGFNVRAEYYTVIESVAALDQALRWCRKRQLPFFILGGGSNIVFTRDIEGLVIHIALRGYHFSKNNQRVAVNIAAGENWHAVVQRSLQQGAYGLENLALIPGLAGAAPIQNIGAYGVEVCELLQSVDVYDIETGNELTLAAEECDFAYRHSLFKTEAGKRYIVTALQLELATENTPKVRYQALTDYLSARGTPHPTGEQVFDAVCAIRQEKLPDPAKVGNVGSFFKNPVVSRQKFDALRTSYPAMPGYQSDDNQFKVPAAWLIDRAGWKGHRFEQVGVHNAQALVLVNHGGGNGQQIAVLADRIRQDVLQRYGVQLEREPHLY